MITKAQARTIYDAIADNKGVIPPRTNKRVYWALYKQGLSEWVDVFFGNGAIGGRRVVSQRGYEAARAFYRSTGRHDELITLWERLHAGSKTHS